MAGNDDTSAAPAGDTGQLLDDYLTENQLANELGVTVRTLRNWRAVGDSPPVTRIGNRNYIARPDGREWLEKIKGRRAGECDDQSGKQS